MSETQNGSIESVQAAGGYGPPGGGGGWGPPHPVHLRLVAAATVLPRAAVAAAGAARLPVAAGTGSTGSASGWRLRSTAGWIRRTGRARRRLQRSQLQPARHARRRRRTAVSPAGHHRAGPRHPLLRLTTCCCCFGGWSIPISIAAGVVGFLGLQQVKANPARFKGDIFCYIGIGAGAFGVICCILAFVTSVDEQLMQHRHF